MNWFRTFRRSKYILNKDITLVLFYSFRNSDDLKIKMEDYNESEDENFFWLNETVFELVYSLLRVLNWL